MATIGIHITPFAAITFSSWLSAPWLSFLCLVLIVAAIAFASWRIGWKKFLMWVEFAYLIRFQLIGALLLAVVLPAGRFLAPSIFIGLFDALGPLSFGLVVYASLQLAFTIMITWRLTQFYGPERFAGIRELPQGRPTWATTFLFSALALPLIGMTTWGTEIPWIEKLLGFVIGAAVSVLVLWITAKAHVKLENEGGYSARYIYPPWSSLEYIPGTPRSSLGRQVDGVLDNLLPPELRGGIIAEHDRGLRSGHQLAALTLLAQGVIYIAVGLLTSPRVMDWQPAAMFYVLFLFALLTWFFSGLAFFLDLVRIPVLTTCVAASLLLGFIKTDHVFELQKYEAKAEPLPPNAVIQAWEHHQAHDDKTAPMVIVATAGGGIRATAWTAEVLTGLTESCPVMPGGHTFASSLVLMSAVSGGSVGAMYFVGAYNQGNSPADLDDIRATARRSSLGAVGWGFLYPDLVRIVPGLGSIITPILGQSVDRGWALEREWVNHWPGFTWKTRPTIRAWSGDVRNGVRPAVIFNATASETGQRFLAGSTVLTDPTATTSYKPSIQFSEDFPGLDLPVSTAVRLSATFPWVSPMPRPSLGDPQYRVHVGDGGYYDNSGILSAVEWLVAAKDAVHQHPVYLLIIDSTPDLPAKGESWTWQRQIVAPIGSLLSVRTSSQLMRAQYELRLAEDLLTQNGLHVTQVPFRYPSEPSSPLSWHLTPSQIRNIQKAWADRKNENAGLLKDLNCTSSK